MTKKRKDRRPARKTEKLIREPYVAETGEPEKLTKESEIPEPEAVETGEPELTLPEGFTARMRSLLTDDEYREFLASYQKKRRFSLRVNPLKVSREGFLALVRADEKLCAADAQENGTERPVKGKAEDPAADHALETTDNPAAGSAEDSAANGGFLPVPWEPDGFYYEENIRPGRHPRHEAGMYYIQEASAMVPAMLCGAQPGDKVLDLCAAPGGKATKLAASLCGQGVLVANEIHPARARILSSNIERMGVRNAVVTSETPQQLASRFPSFFDRIVVDAPCSGEGMFRKEEEAVRHWSLENVRMCGERQLDILEEAAVMLRPGGRLVYSTCTFSPEENETVIGTFLAYHPDFSICRIQDLPGVDMEGWGFEPGHAEWAGIPDRAVPEDRRQIILRQLDGTVRLWPHRLDGEGHFAAVLQKKGPEREQPERGQPELSGRQGGVLSSVPSGEMPAAETAGSAGRTMTDNKKENRKKRKKSGGAKTQKDQGRLQMLELWREFCQDTLNLPLNFPEDRLFLFGESLYALPFETDTLSFEGMRVLRPGLQLGTSVKGRFVPAHALGMALGREEVRRAIDLPGNSPEAYAWIRGESIPAEADTGKGWTLVMIDGCAAGWGKAAGSMIKNHYPKGLRRNIMS